MACFLIRSAPQLWKCGLQGSSTNFRKPSTLFYVSSRAMHCLPSPGRAALSSTARFSRNHVQARLQHGMNEEWAARGNFAILRSFGLCCAITAGSFAVATIVELETRRGRLYMYPDLLLYSALGTFATVFAMSQIKNAHFQKWFRRSFYISLASFRPAQMIGSFVNHAGGLHLLVNVYMLFVLHSTANNDRQWPAGSFAGYTVALALSGSVWAVFTHYCLYVKYLSKVGDVPHFIGCGASAGITAVIGSHIGDTRTRFNFMFVPNLTFKKLAILLAGIDTIGLCLGALRIFQTRVDHTSHLLGLSFGLLLTVPQVRNSLAAYKSFVLDQWLKVRPYFVGRR